MKQAVVIDANEVREILAEKFQVHLETGGAGNVELI